MIVFDPGHGGHQAAGISEPLGHRAVSGHYEKDLVLNLCRAAAQATPHAVTLTRTEDRNLSLAERIGVSRAASARSFVSVHLGHQPPGQRGSIVWLHPAAGPASERLALQMAEALAWGGRRQVRVQQAALAVLHPERHLPTTAAILVEVDNLMDATAARALLQPAALADLGTALSHGARPVLLSRADTFSTLLNQSLHLNGLDFHILQEVLGNVRTLLRAPIPITAATRKGRLGRFLARRVLVTAANLALVGLGSVLEHVIDEFFDTHGPSNLDLFHTTFRHTVQGPDGTHQTYSVAGRTDDPKSVSFEGVLRQFGSDYCKSLKVNPVPIPDVPATLDGMGRKQMLKRVIGLAQKAYRSMYGHSAVIALGSADAYLLPLAIYRQRFDALREAFEELKAKDPATLDARLESLGLEAYLDTLSGGAARLPRHTTRDLLRAMVADFFAESWNELVPRGKSLSSELLAFLTRHDLATIADDPRSRLDKLKQGVRSDPQEEKARFDRLLQAARSGSYLAATSEKGKWGTQSQQVLRTRVVEVVEQEQKKLATVAALELSTRYPEGARPRATVPTALHPVNMDLKIRVDTSIAQIEEALHPTGGTAPATPRP